MSLELYYGLVIVKVEVEVEVEVEVKAEVETADVYKGFGGQGLKPDERSDSIPQ